MKPYFIAATYNEEKELPSLISHVSDIVSGYRIVDDGSTDLSVLYLKQMKEYEFILPDDDFEFRVIGHTGLPETVKAEALKMVPDDSWVLMLDADERLTPETIESIKEFFGSEEYLNYDYVYFQQLELIDGVHVRSFQKAKLFKKEVIGFSKNNIHVDDAFIGEGTYKDNWIVLHRKTSNKQIQREQEYLETYKKLLDEGSIDEGRYNWLRGLHHYVR